jgi:hypothetical protein
MRIEITIDDLVQKCPECDGRGYHEDKPHCRICGEYVPDGFDDMSEKLPCGHLTRNLADETGCGECEGTGERFTPTGSALAAFMHKLIDNRLADYARRNSR